jgi:hypothetical protein
MLGDFIERNLPSRPKADPNTTYELPPEMILA